MTPHINHTTGDAPYIGIDDRAMFNGRGAHDPGDIDEELADPLSDHGRNHATGAGDRPNETANPGRRQAQQIWAKRPG
jgi:hypothetical protein